MKHIEPKEAKVYVGLLVMVALCAAMTFALFMTASTILQWLGPNAGFLVCLIRMLGLLTGVSGAGLIIVMVSFYKNR